MAWDFHVGQHVECIADGFRDMVERPSTSIILRPVRGWIYTIRSLHVDSSKPWRDFLFIRLVELRNPNVSDEWGEPAFRADGFRPLDARRLDPLRAHLVPVPSRRRRELA